MVDHMTHRPASHSTTEYVLRSSNTHHPTSSIKKYPNKAPPKSIEWAIVVYDDDYDAFLNEECT